MRTNSTKTLGLKFRRGITLTELMVAALLSSLVLIGTYAVLRSGIESDNITLGMSMAWERLDLARDMLATDADAAAYSGTPNSTVDPWICPKPWNGTVYQGLMVRETDSAPTWAGTDNPNIFPDECIFQGAALLDELAPDSITGDTIDFQSDLALPINEDDYVAMFENRFLRITSPNGFSQFAEVVAVDFEEHKVQLEFAPARATDIGVCGILGTGGQDHEVTIHTYFRYRIIEHPTEPNSTALVREEVYWPELEWGEEPEVIPGTQLIVAENIVDLQCWADGVSAGLTPLFTPDSNGGVVRSAYASTGSAVNLDPEVLTDIERARIFHFQITARTSREYDSVPHRPRGELDNGAFDIMRTFDLDGDPSTAALTQTIHHQVALQNFIVRSLN
ncbi:MAG: hypothetical protein KC561_03565 [Myxococcales bacterium]|nr:hypothetical protein [Myxococcales bacterium]